ncbi:MAG: two pore domain potassium channel family protein [Thiohalocapsa sp. PB-PSB1]|nr:MAG: two pore domain potassium channel family protein [Thiohalocapsa sp. PB-PSB1]HCS91674.1 hypothetical protein [Chromatiaceae bacterium]
MGFKVKILERSRLTLGLGRAYEQGLLVGVLFFLVSSFFLFFLLTIGYGDIVPISHLAQTLSVLEGVIGQLYLVVYVAVLVGMYLYGRMAKDTAAGSSS